MLSLLLLSPAIASVLNLPPSGVRPPRRRRCVRAGDQHAGSAPRGDGALPLCVKGGRPGGNILWVGMFSFRLIALPSPSPRLSWICCCCCCCCCCIGKREPEGRHPPSARQAQGVRGQGCAGAAGSFGVPPGALALSEARANELFEFPSALDYLCLSRGALPTPNPLRLLVCLFSSGVRVAC